MSVTFLLLVAATGVTAQYSIPDNPVSPSILPPFDCSSRADGWYSAEKCAEIYYSCVSGLAYENSCLSGLVFDDKKGFCEHPEQCGLTIEEPALSTFPSYGSTDTTLPTNSECAGRADGIFALNDCSSKYISCVGGHAFEQSCPSGLVFDSSKSACEFETQCGMASLPSVSPYPEVTFTPPQPSDECAGKTDGIYSKGHCVGKYFSCSGGISYPQLCPGLLVFDEIKGVCEYLDRCGVVDEEIAVNPYTVPTSGAPVTTLAPTRTDCIDKADGVYSIGICLTTYLMCSGGLTYSLSCPAGLVFDESKGVCDYSESCGIEVTTFRTTERPNYSTVTTYQPVRNDCIGKPDGSYAISECGNAYQMCAGGLTYDFSCSSGLVFDSSKAQCVFPSDCGASAVPPVEVSTSGSPTTVPSTFQCTVDGIFSIGCVADYIQCSNGVGLRRSCPQGLVFNEQKLTCDYSCEDVSGTSAIPSSSPAYPTTATSTPQVSTVVSPGLCSAGETKSGGDCSSKFFRCRNGLWVSTICSGRTVFDDDLALCVYNLPRCRAGSSNNNQPGIEYATSVSESPAPAAYGSQAQTSNVPYSAPQPAFYSWPSAFLSNPFYVKRHRFGHSNHRHHFGFGSESRGEEVENFGRLNAGHKDVVVPGPHYPVADSFSHRTLPSYGLTGTFPKSRVRSLFLRKSFEDDSSEPEEPEDASDQEADMEEGSGDDADKSIGVRRKRSYGMPDYSSYTGNADSICTVDKVKKIVALGRCRLDFVYCRDVNEEVLAACAVGELYDSDIARCIGARLCGSDGVDDTVPTETEVFIPVVSTPQTTVSTGNVVFPSESVYPAVPADIEETTPLAEVDNGDASATLLPSGNACTSDFVSGCSSSFLVCVNGRYVAMECPSGLVYDRNEKGCNYPESVSSCGDSEDSSPAQSLNTLQPIGSTQIYPAVSVPSHSSSPRVNVPSGSACTEDFSNECSSSYSVCVNGQYIAMSCPVGLVYDVKLKACNFRENVVSCAGDRRLSNSEVTQPRPYVVDSSVQNPSSASPSIGPYRPGVIVASSDDEGAVLTGYSASPGIPLPTSSSAVPYKPVPRPTSSPDLAFNVCAGSSSLIALSSCSNDFVHCSEGRIVGHFSCPHGLVFNSKNEQCVYREEMADCGMVSMDVTSDTSIESGSSTNSWVVPTAGMVFPTAGTVPPLSTEGIENREELASAEVVTGSLPGSSSPAVTAMRSCDGLVKNSRCSKSYSVCDGGMVYDMSCPDGLVYNTLSASCDFPHLVDGCLNQSSTDFPLSTSETVPSTTDEAVQITSANVVDAIELQPLTNFSSTTSTENGLNIHASSNDDDEVGGQEQPQCDSLSKPIPIGLCSLRYMVCKNGRYEETQCLFGQLFSSARLECVPSAECLQPQTGRVSGIDSRCSIYANGNGVSALGQCQNNFLLCSNGVANIKNCPGNLVFSGKKRRCVRRISEVECDSEGQAHYPAADVNETSFCAGKQDGFFADPSDCSGIVMCFGGEALRMPSCTSGLLFNAKTQKCDYPQNVPSCKQTNSGVTNGCGGAAHGAYIADESDCTVFYRCVWNRLTKMHCPTGTVFNPALSICDWPTAVPQCSSSSPTSSTTTLSY